MPIGRNALLAAGLVMPGVAQAFGPASNISESRALGTCSIGFLASGARQEATVQFGGIGTASGGSIWFSIAPGTGIAVPDPEGPIAVSNIESCGFTNVTDLSQRGADAASFTAQDYMGFSFRAEEADGSTYDYEYALVGASDTSVVVTRTLVSGPPTAPEEEAEPAPDEEIALYMADRMRQLVRRQPEFISLAFGQGATGLSGQVSRGGGHLSFGSRAQGTWASLDASWSNREGSDNHYALGSVGAYLAAGPSTFLGAMVQFDDYSRDDSAGDVDGTGWLVGPYAVGSLPGAGLTYEARALYGRSSNDVSPSGNEFDSERLLVQGRLQGDVAFGAATLFPYASATYAKDRQEGFTDATGAAIASQTVRMRELEAGLDFLVPFDLSNGELDLVGGISLISASVSGPAGSASFDTPYDGLTGAATLGVDYRLSPSSQLTLRTSVDGLGTSDYEAYGIGLTFSSSF